MARTQSPTAEENLIVKGSPVDGQGCFSWVRLPARKKFGEFVGEKIGSRQARRRVARGGRISICELDRRWSIDASRSGRATVRALPRSDAVTADGNLVPVHEVDLAGAPGSALFTAFRFFRAAGEIVFRL